MAEYGYIDEAGQLVSVRLEEHRKTLMVGGDATEIVVTVEAQLDELEGGPWKPVDEMYYEQGLGGDDLHDMDVQPYDAGDHISFKYKQVFSAGKAKIMIEQLKQQLHDEDYKIVKSYECSLLGETLPYNVKELHEKRNAIRNQINELKARIERAQ